MAKYNIYAIAVGIDPNTKEPVYNLKFKTWDECKPYVVGVEGAKYKGFLTEDEADAWLNKCYGDIVIKAKENSKDSNPEDKIRNWKEDINKITKSKIHPVDEEFIYTCRKLGVSQINVEHILKKSFIDTVKYLDENDCLASNYLDDCK